MLGEESMRSEGNFAWWGLVFEFSLMLLDERTGTLAHKRHVSHIPEGSFSRIRLGGRLMSPFRTIIWTVSIIHVLEGDIACWEAN